MVEQRREWVTNSRGGKAEGLFKFQGEAFLLENRF